MIQIDWSSITVLAMYLFERNENVETGQSVALI